MTADMASAVRVFSELRRSAMEGGSSAGMIA